MFMLNPQFFLKSFCSPASSLDCLSSASALSSDMTEERVAASPEERRRRVSAQRLLKEMVQLETIFGKLCGTHRHLTPLSTDLSRNRVMRVDFDWGLRDGEDRRTCTKIIIKRNSFEMSTSFLLSPP